MKTSETFDRALVEEIREALASDFAKLQTVIADVQRLATEIRGEVTEIRSQVAEIRGEVTEIRSQVAEIRGEVTEIRSQVAEIRGEVMGLRGKVESLRDFQIDQERALHSEMSSARFVGHGRLLPRQSNLVDYGTHFKHRRSRDRPASIY